MPISLSDWDSKVVSVMFLPNCNMRCPFCYNKNLVLCPEKVPTIKLKQAFAYLGENKGWIDGVVVTGGEPTLHRDLPVLCKTVKELGLKVKVDTNGTSPAVVSELIEKKLVDYVAMDVKAELTEEAYSNTCGVDVGSFLEQIKSTVMILLSGKIEYEFRTTLVPRLHKVADVGKICGTIKGCTKYALQNFKPNVETIDPTFQTMKSFSKTEMDMFLKAAQRIIPNTILRG